MVARQPVVRDSTAREANARLRGRPGGNEMWMVWLLVTLMVWALVALLLAPVVGRMLALDGRPPGHRAVALRGPRSPLRHYRL